MNIKKCMLLWHLLMANRLYTEEFFFNEMWAHAIPEMQRSNLVSCVIQVCISVAILLQWGVNVAIPLLLSN